MPGQLKITVGDKEWLASLANTYWEQAQGLGGIAEISPGTGMLFDLGPEQTITVTTEPMLFSLDIVFFSEDMIITEIYRNVQPGYLVTSTSPARYFLEVKLTVNLSTSNPNCCASSMSFCIETSSL